VPAMVHFGRTELHLTNLLERLNGEIKRRRSGRHLRESRRQSTGSSAILLEQNDERAMRRPPLHNPVNHHRTQ
jgi:hypothetical protein